MDIEKIIADLLYEYDAVTLPGFGGLTLQSHAAEIDQAAETIRPPSKKVRFNPNLVLNDGFLTARIRDRYNVPQEAAAQSIYDFIKDLKDKLEQGNTVELTDVGRFFKSGNQYQFVAAPTNYDKSAYGLPEVKSERIITNGTETLTFKKTEIADENQKTTVSPKEYGRTLQWAIPVLAVVAIALIVFTIRGDLFSGKSSLKDDFEKQERVNKSPEDRDITPVSENEQIDDDDEMLDTEAPTIAPNQKVKKIIIGAFSERGNAEKLIKEVQLAGYTPLSEMRNGKRYVGITYAYEENAEFERAFADIKKRFSEGAWILTE